MSSNLDSHEEPTLSPGSKRAPQSRDGLAEDRLTIVVDTLGATDGSQAVVTQYLLGAWREVNAADEVHLVLSDDLAMDVPDWIVVHRVPLRRPRMLRRTLAQIVALRRICREVSADVLLATAPASAMADIGVPRALIVYDLRHELRPQQFSRLRRWQRKISWGYNFRAAASFACISNRTRDDLLRSRPKLSGKHVVVAHLGADHVDDWAVPPDVSTDGYALAFGHFGNKNVDAVVAAWVVLAERGTAPPLKICGLPPTETERLETLAKTLGIGHLVEALGWAPQDEFRVRFAGAAMIVFPSDFEGFGLPVVEAMRLGKRAVISSDPALLEVSGGHAAVARSADPEPLADAVEAALRFTPDQLAEAQRFAERYRWAATVQVVREALRVAAGA